MAHSLKYLRKKAGMPAPTGFVQCVIPRTRRIPRPAFSPMPLSESVARVKPRSLSPKAEELFIRLFAQVGPHEELHFTPIYELALDLFAHVYGRVPSNVPQFQELRRKAAAGQSIPLFQ